MHWRFVLAGFAALSSFAGGPALAQDASQSGAATDKPPSIQSSLGPFGDPGGWRAAAEARGVTINLSYTNEMLGNLSGGLRRHGVYAGKLEAQLGIDLGTMAGWQGLAFFANAFQIHDTGGLRDRTFGRLVTVSNIEAYPSTRLSEIWLEQKWAGDRFGLRIGQITADGEFFSADYGRIFLSNDWPTITGANLPAGGPAYPISTPGIRFRAQPTDSLTALFAIFNGDPGDQKEVNRDGLRFPLRDPALLMGEVQYRYGQDKESTGLAGTWRLGGYHRLGRFDDLRYDRTGLALLHPTSNGEPRRLRGMSGLYGVVDHQLWRPEGGSHEDGILVYGRLSASPSDRSHIDLWADGGLVFSGLVPGRPHDQFGMSFIYSRIGRALRSADRDAQIHAGAFAPIRSYEATFEATYAAQIAPGWVVQPDIQYVYRPAGGVENPYRPGTLLKGGFIVGLRSTLTY